MRSLGLLVALAGCDVLFRVDGIAPMDAPGAGASIAFVQNLTTTCNQTTTCTVAIAPPIAAGDRVIVTVTYDTTVTPMLTMSDDAASSYAAVVAPLQWGQYGTTTWSATAGGPITKLTVELSVSVATIDVYVNEYTPSAVDTATHAVGGAGALAISSGSHAASQGERVFGHAEAEFATVGAGSGFAVLTTQNGNIEEDELAATPGDYAAQFTLAQPSSWVALMVLLR